MNKWIGMGRLTRDPEVKYTRDQNPICIARYSLAIDRRPDKEGKRQADFISCVAFGKAGEFAEKYLKKGTKICVSGHLQTGSYTDAEGIKRYRTDCVIEEQEFAESKKSSEKDAYDSQMAAQYSGSGQQAARTQGYVGFANEEGFVNIPDGIDEELPFT